MATKREIDEYLETALWSSNDESDERGGEPMDRNYSVSDFAPEARERAKQDLDMFEFEMDRVLEKVEDEDLDTTQWPHDFWLTRNGHGVGFWDRPERYGSVAEALTALAQRAGEVYIYVGDDGQVYFG